MSLEHRMSNDAEHALPLQRVEADLDALANLVASGPDARLFYGELLKTAVRLFDAWGGAVWLLDGGSYRLVCEERLIAWGLGANAALRELHEVELAKVVHARQASVVQLNQNDHASGESDRWMRLFPFKRDSEVFAVLETIEFHDPSLQPQLSALGEAFEELAVDFSRSESLRMLRANEVDWRVSQQYACEVHQRLDLQYTSYTIAHESRRLLGCDRATVADYRGGQAKVVAISGIEQVERRTLQVQCLETLFAVVAEGRESIQSNQNANAFAPQIQQALEQYFDIAPTKWIAIYPVFEKSQTADAPVIGLFCWERFDQEESPEQLTRMSWVFEHAQSAYRNAWEYSTLPLLKPAQSMRRMVHGVMHRKRLAWTIGLAAMVCFIAILCVVPMQFYVSAAGTMQPSQVQHLFAPSNAEVVEVLTDHGQRVTEQAPLVRLRSHELELTHQQVLGEKKATQEKLQVLEATLLGERSKPTDTGPDRDQLLATSQRELQELLESQDQQLAILRRAINQLEVRSPLDGTVVTWDVSRKLQQHPVSQGQLLLSVARLDGPWELELEVPESQIGYVRSAAETTKEPLSVVYYLAANSSQTHHASIRKLSMTAELNRESKAMVRVTADVMPEEALLRNPGAVVMAKIDCGSRSVAFVWFHELIDFCRRKLWL